METFRYIDTRITTWLARNGVTLLRLRAYLKSRIKVARRQRDGLIAAP